MLDIDENKPLVNMTITDFDETIIESPTRRWINICILESMGVSLGTMVANYQLHKRGWDDRWEEFSKWAEKGMVYQRTLLDLVDEDTNSFNKIMDAFQITKRFRRR